MPPKGSSLGVACGSYRVNSSTLYFCGLSWSVEKDFAYPTDSGLLPRGIKRLVKGTRTVQRLGVAGEKRVRSFKRMGKRAKPDEYGSKVLLSLGTNGYGVAHRDYPSNPADSELLEDAVRDWQQAFGQASREKPSGRTPKEVGADRGFHRSSYEGDVLEEVERLAIPRKGKTPHPKADRSWFKRVQGRRAAEEPIIGHLKADHRMDRCRYKGFEGDVINVCFASVAWNLKKWGRTLATI